MISSLWRYSHFLLALVSAIFIFVASITGSLLALEPISEASKSYVIPDLDAIYISDTIENLEHKFPEVLEIEVLANNSVKASVFTIDGISENIYINPRTGDTLGDVPSRSIFFSFMKIKKNFNNNIVSLENQFIFKTTMEIQYISDSS